MADIEHVRGLISEIQYFKIDLDSEYREEFENMIHGKIIALRSYCALFSLQGATVQLDRLLTDNDSLIPALEYVWGFIIPELSLKLDHYTDYGDRSNDFWNDLHPIIAEVSRNRFESEQYADAVEAAFKEINSRIKTIYKERVGEELDGAKLISNAFSPKRPYIFLGDLETESGKSMQQGYMQIFAGSLQAIRNPKAHANIIIGNVRCLHFLYLASLLMYKLDEEIKPSNDNN